VIFVAKKKSVGKTSKKSSSFGAFIKKGGKKK